jgi:hypothetical protein
LVSKTAQGVVIAIDLSFNHKDGHDVGFPEFLFDLLVEESQRTAFRQN